MAANGLYNEDGSMRVSVVGGSSGGSAGGTVAQGAAGTDPWLVSARQSGTWTAAVTQSGSWTVTLGAGTAAIGKVEVSNFPALQSVVTTPSGSTPRGVFTIAAGGLATAVGLPNIPGDATTALVIPDGAGLRWRDDGTDPTASVGVPAPVGSFLKLYGPEIAATKFIAQAAGASLTVRYGK